MSDTNIQPGPDNVIPIDFKVGTPKLIVEADALGNVKTPAATAPQQENYTVRPFPDGFIFKYTHNPTQPGTFVLFDSQRKPIAVVESPAICNMLCNAAKLMFDLAMAEQQRLNEGATPAA